MSSARWAEWPHWTAVRIGLISAYAVGYVWWFFAEGIIIDRISVLLSVIIVLVLATIGRPLRTWARLFGDLAVFVAMWILYDESRGIADRVGMPIQVESVRNIDHFLFGTDVTVWLQDQFLGAPGNVRWYDVVGSMVYYSHFIVPPLTIVVLYIANRYQWVRYMRRFATLLFIACAMFILLPTAPPWMAAGGTNRVGLDLDVLPPVRRTTGAGWNEIGLSAFVKAWDTGRDWANQVAAMPSLHAAFALFVVVFFFPWIRSWWIRGIMLLYPLTMAVALSYFAEHYMIDAIAGWAVVGLSFLLWNRIERSIAERRLAMDLAPTRSEQSGVAPTIDVELYPSGEPRLLAAEEGDDLAEVGGVAHDEV
jgi:hypothetical protein